MIQARGQLNLSKKALAAERFSEIGMQHFDRDFPIVLEVVGQVDGGHPARAELAVEAIAIGERFDQCNGGVHAGRVHRGAVVGQPDADEFHGEPVPITPRSAASCGNRPEHPASAAAPFPEHPG